MVEREGGGVGPDVAAGAVEVEGGATRGGAAAGFGGRGAALASSLGGLGGAFGLDGGLAMAALRPDDTFAASRL